MQVRSIFTLVMLGTSLLLFGCATPQSTATSNQSGATGNEREQIQTAVRNYVTVQPNASQYDITVDKISGNWARVIVKPSGANAQPTYVIMKKQDRSVPAPAPSLTTSPLTPLAGSNPPPLVVNTPPAQTSAGWAVVLGPKANFTQAELDGAGVPPDVRPPTGD